MPSPPLRIGILGPRRTRQGLGPRLAECIEHCGGRVTAIASSKFRSLGPAATDLEARLGHGVEGYVGVDSMLSNAELDALVIASPAATREDALLGALDYGLHVFSEAPVVEPGRTAADRLEMLADSFATAGLHLRVDVQWPRTLPVYYELFPTARSATIESFRMQLWSAVPGLALLPDSMAHPLSMLQALCPGPDAVLRSPEIDLRTEDGSIIEVTFGYDNGEVTVPCSIDLRSTQDPPRAVSYGINAMFATGRIREADRLEFHHRERSVAVPDPLEQEVGAFLDLLRSTTPPEREVLAVQRLRMLESLMA